MPYTACLAAVKHYTPDAVRAGLQEILAALGGLDQYVRTGQRVLIKPNLIDRRPNSQTNAIVIVELAKLVRELGAMPVIADSTAWHSVITNAKTSGLYQLTLENDIPLFELRQPRRMKAGNRHLTVSQQALDADVILNVPKLKTHQQLKLTAGIKNMFGCVPGKRKALWHFRAGAIPLHFGRMLVETYQLLKPAITIIDAIDAMEGSGPINGPLRRLGALIGSNDGFAAELVACELVNCDPMTLVTMQAAREMNLGPRNLTEVNRLGADINSLKVSDFKFPDLHPLWFSFPRVTKSTLKQLWLLLKEKLKT